MDRPFSSVYLWCGSAPAHGNRLRRGFAGICQKRMSFRQINGPSRTLLVERSQAERGAQGEHGSNRGEKAAQRLAPAVERDHRLLRALSGNAGENRAGPNFDEEVGFLLRLAK